MIKELIISFIIVIVIFIGNFITEKYTNESIMETSSDLSNLKQKIENKNYDKNIMENDIDFIIKKWDERYEKLAFYIEHNELEKIKTELVYLEGCINNDDNSECIPEINKCIFILEHIKDKSVFNLKNIF